MAYAVYMVSENEEKRRYSTIFEKGEYNTLKAARECLTRCFRYLLEKENVNETQPTWNFKDKWHLYDQSGKKVTHLVCKKYKSDKMSHINNDLLWEMFDDITINDINYLKKYA